METVCARGIGAVAVDPLDGSTLAVLATHVRRDEARIRVLVVVGFRRRE